MVAAMGLEATKELDAVRLLVLLNRVSDADLRIARDRFSHRIYRDEIWRVAADLGHGDVFPPAAEFEAPVAGHRSFIDRGMRRTVAIVDPHFGAEGASDLADHSEEDTLERSSLRSLEVVGNVILRSLESITARLVKIDRFSESPVVVEPQPPAETESEPSEEGAAQAGEPDAAPPGEPDAAPPGDPGAAERPQEAVAP
jgi:hypothetical protein